VADLSLTVREAIIPEDNENRPGYAMVPEYVTVHETSNYAAGADAEMHRRFVANGGGSAGVSFHWVVDDKEAIHLVPDDEVAWHAGDGATGTGNRQSVAIETCVNSGSDWSLTRRNLAILTAQLMHRHGIPLVNIVQHNFWSGKNCPLIIRRDGQWAGQVAATKVAYEAMSQPAVSASPYISAWPALWG
jgi:N-acetylmuramoyl-L-alanine amidase